MKKIILTLAFVAGITTVNANTNSNTNNEIANQDDCLAYACEGLAEFEDWAGGVDEGTAEFIVNTLYDQCTG